MRLFIRNEIARINRMRAEFGALSDGQVREAAARTNQLLPYVALVAVAVSRVLGQDMFDVQLQGALALARGRQTIKEGWVSRLRALKSLGKKKAHAHD